MNDFTRFVSFVKSQAKFHADRAQGNASHPSRQEFHAGIAATFHELTAFLQDLASKPLDAGPTESPEKSNILISAKEFKKLPDEVIEELGLSDSARLDMTLESIIEQNGGTASLDRIIVDLFHETGEVHVRAKVNARLYRMIKRGRIAREPGVKGVYTTPSRCPE